MSIYRMRTAPQAIEEIKAVDPNTALTLRALQRKIKSGEIPSVSVGNKRLINLDTLLDDLFNPVDNSASSTDYGKVRRIV